MAFDIIEEANKIANRPQIHIRMTEDDRILLEGCVGTAEQFVQMTAVLLAKSLAENAGYVGIPPEVAKLFYLEMLVKELSAAVDETEEEKHDENSKNDK